MRVLVLDAALGQCMAGAVQDAERVIAERRVVGSRGHAAALPAMAAAVLAEAGWASGSIELLAMTIGPGSFTGIRAALSLAQGLALASGAAVIGVTVGEALAAALPQLGERSLWVVTASRRESVFLERNGAVTSLAFDALPAATGPIALAGNAATEVAARLAARTIPRAAVAPSGMAQSGMAQPPALPADVVLTDARFPQPLPIAIAALRRRNGALPPRAAEPLYVDPPEGHPAAGGLRPPPVGT